MRHYPEDEEIYEKINGNLEEMPKADIKQAAKMALRSRMTIKLHVEQAPKLLKAIYNIP